MQNSPETLTGGKHKGYALGAIWQHASKVSSFTFIYTGFSERPTSHSFLKTFLNIVQPFSQKVRRRIDRHAFRARHLFSLTFVFRVFSSDRPPLFSPSSLRHASNRQTSRGALSPVQTVGLILQPHSHAHRDRQKKRLQTAIRSVCESFPKQFVKHICLGMKANSAGIVSNCHVITRKASQCRGGGD